MKTTFLLALSLLTLVSARAEVFRPSTVNGAVVGGLAGALIGSTSGDRDDIWRGAAVGAVAGGLIGAASDSHGHSRHSHVSVSVGYGYGPGYYGAYRPYYQPYRPYNYYSYYSRPVYYTRPSYASSGLFWGGLTGAIIGNNSHGHNAWRGAAWGAGAGLLVGAIADANVREREAREQAYAEAKAAFEAQQNNNTATQQQTAPQNVTIINNNYGSGSTPMSSANGLFGR
ncbi:MAG: YMGG-like glycine zipper-containing protein [Nibricoccus sp.]